MIKDPERREMAARFGKHVQNWRLAQDYSRRRFATMVGIKRDTLVAYELGNRLPDLQIALRLARVCGSTVEEMTR